MTLTNTESVLCLAIIFFSSAARRKAVQKQKYVAWLVFSFGQKLFHLLSFLNFARRSKKWKNCAKKQLRKHHCPHFGRLPTQTGGVGLTMADPSHSGGVVLLSPPLLLASCCSTAVPVEMGWVYPSRLGWEEAKVGTMMLPNNLGVSYSWEKLMYSWLHWNIFRWESQKNFSPDQNSFTPDFLLDHFSCHWLSHDPSDSPDTLVTMLPRLRVREE